MRISTTLFSASIVVKDQLGDIDSHFQSGSIKGQYQIAGGYAAGSVEGQPGLTPGYRLAGGLAAAGEQG